MVNSASKVSNAIMQDNANIADSARFCAAKSQQRKHIVRHLESTELRKEVKKYSILASHFTTSAMPWYDSRSIHNLIQQESEGQVSPNSTREKQ